MHLKPWLIVNCTMLTKQQILKKLSSAKPLLQEKYDIKSLALFGSYSRNTDVRTTSDIDVLVEFYNPVGIKFIDLADELEQMLQNKVDLVSRNGLMPKYYKAIEPELIYV
jgi:predicted nucleotidyltransferase